MVPVWLDSVVLLRVAGSLCAGVVVAPRGEGDVVVATAYHCVATGQVPEVGFRNGNVTEGRVIARDPARDLALVAVEGGSVSAGVTGLPVRADDPTIGERVVALGHPYGTAAAGKLEGVLQWSAAEGIVGAVGPWVLQTDAGLNPGNSGGPLVDAQGRVAGIVSRKLAAEDLTFAAKSTDLARMLAKPEAGPRLGGTWGLAPVVRTGETTLVGGTLFVTVRERVVARGWLAGGRGGLAMGAGALELRQRLGRGALSTTLDAGVGLRGEGTALEAALRPVLTGRVATSGIALGAHAWNLGDAEKRGWDLSVELEWPGVVGVW